MPYNAADVHDDAGFTARRGVPVQLLGAGPKHKATDSAIHLPGFSGRQLGHPPASNLTYRSVSETGTVHKRKTGHELSSTSDATCSHACNTQTLGKDGNGTHAASRWSNDTEGSAARDSSKSITPHLPTLTQLPDARSLLSSSAAIAALTRSASILHPGHCRQLAALARLLPAAGVRGKALQRASRPPTGRGQTTTTTSTLCSTGSSSSGHQSASHRCSSDGRPSSRNASLLGGLPAGSMGLGYPDGEAAGHGQELPTMLRGVAAEARQATPAAAACGTEGSDQILGRTACGSAAGNCRYADEALRPGSSWGASPCSSGCSSPLQPSDASCHLSSSMHISPGASDPNLASQSSCLSCSSSSSNSAADKRSSSSVGDAMRRTLLRQPKQQQEQQKPKQQQVILPPAVALSLTDPDEWLHQQHPAVRCCIQADIDRWQASQQQQQQECGRCDSPAPKSPQACTCVDRTTTGSAQPPTEGSLQLLQPQFPGTAPTICFTQVRSVGGTAELDCPLLTAVQENAGGSADSGSSSSSNQDGPLQAAEATVSTIPLKRCKLLVKYDGAPNKSVKQVFRAAGFKRTKGDSWSVMWGITPSPELLAGLGAHQKVNHFPGTWELGRKDRLYHHMAAAKRRLGLGFDLVPRFFIMPWDAEELRTDNLQNPGQVYIKKPVASSRGRGISVVNNIATLKLSSLQDVLLQRYIDPPYLVNGHKFDLRVYVAVTCLDPLRVYVYREGLVRFAAERYSQQRSSRSHRCMHLTNYSVNKKSKGHRPPSGTAAAVAAACAAVAASQRGLNPGPAGSLGAAAAPAAGRDSGGGSICGSPELVDMREEQEVQDQAEETQQQEQPSEKQQQEHKWSFAQLRDHMEARGHSWSAVWEQVEDIVAKTLIAAEPAMLSASQRQGSPRATNCFELFGFDILLDKQRRAWLLEVNTTPALNTDSTLDQALKAQLVADLIHLVGVVPCDQVQYATHAAAERAARLAGLAHTAGGARAASRLTPAQPSSSSSGGASGSSSRRLTASSSVGGGTSASLRYRVSENGLEVAAGSTAADKRAVAAAVAAVADMRNIRDLAGVDVQLLQRLCPHELPEIIRDTAAEQCRQQQTAWMRLLPGYAGTADYLHWFETPRLSNELLAKYLRLRGP